MIFLTSISPHTDPQTIATWKGDVISINTPKEIERIKSNFLDVEFIASKNNMPDTPYIRLGDFMNVIKERGECMLINSDIEIIGEIMLTETKDTLHLFQRIDYSDNRLLCETFRSGWDAFYITKELAYRIPRTQLTIGQCHWDYFIPMIAINNRFRLVSPKKQVMYHRRHDLRYDAKRWMMTARIFASELNLTGNPHYDSSRSHRVITSLVKYYD